MNFVRLYVGDYLRDTGTLTVAEHGAYFLMLVHAYATEQPLPTGRELHRLLRAQTKVERDAIDAVAAKFWTITDGGLVNARAIKEIERASHQRDVNKEVGKLGGRPKIPKPITESVISSDTESLTESKPNHNPNQTPDTRHQKEDRNTARRSAPTCPKPFDVDEQTWADWTALRKGKKAAVSLTVVDGARHEAEKAGMSLEAFLRVWCVRGSQGLQADWLKPHEISGRQMESTIARENRERVAAFTGGKASARPLITIEAEHGQTPFALG